MKKLDKFLCKHFGHKWVPVYIGGDNFNIIGCYCDKCRFGNEDLTRFLLKTPHNYGTRHPEYWMGEKDKIKEV